MSELAQLRQQLRKEAVQNFERTGFYWVAFDSNDHTPAGRERYKYERELAITTGTAVRRARQSQ